MALEGGCVSEPKDNGRVGRLSTTHSFAGNCNAIYTMLLVKKVCDNIYLNITWELIPSHTYNNRCGQHFCGVGINSFC